MTVDISGVLPFDGHFELGGWLIGAASPSPRQPTVLVYCMAGGGCLASCFDFDAVGFSDLSLARHLVGAGLYVAAFDHPGIGLSTAVPDLYMLDVATVAAAHAHAVESLLDRFTGAELGSDVGPLRPDVVVGLGHSLGGMVLDVAQSRHRCFDALVVLGHGGGGLPEVLTQEEIGLIGRSGPEFDVAVRSLARKRFEPGSSVPPKLPPNGRFFGEDVPAELIAAAASQQAELLYHCGLQVLIPGSIAADMTAIDVPLFLGYGEQDLIAPVHDVVPTYPAARDITLFVLPGAGHMVFLALNRQVLWDRIVTWIDAVAVPATESQRSRR